MSTPWSDMVRHFLEDGYSSSEIVTYFNHPVVTEEYIQLVIENHRRLNIKRTTRKMDGKIRVTVPKPGTEKRVVYDYAQSLGGPQAFYDHLKTTSRDKLAKQLGVDKMAIYTYLRDYVQGRNQAPRWLHGYPNLAMKLKMEALIKGTYKPKRKRLSIKDARNLW